MKKLQISLVLMAFASTANALVFTPAPVSVPESSSLLLLMVGALGLLLTLHKK